MTITDRIVAVIAIICLALYLGVLVWYVPQPGLVIVCVVTVFFAGLDFVRTAFLGKS